jgi:hypothetical protein
MATDEVAEGIGDHSVAVGRGVLVDQRGPHGAVAHPVHEFASAGAGVSSELVARVPQVKLRLTPARPSPYDSS